MALNKVNGGMYGFISHTVNFIKGSCPHECSYCYMARMNNRFKKHPSELRFDNKELDANLGSKNFVFAGSSCDMFADGVSPNWIRAVLSRLNHFPNNKYLFQTKNPKRYADFLDFFPKNSVLGTTIETNRTYPCMGSAPSPEERSSAIEALFNKKTFITIEPVMDFDLGDFVALVKNARPNFVNIGADSGNNKLPEPPGQKLSALVDALEPVAKIHLKPNLKRIFNA